MEKILNLVPTIMMVEAFIAVIPYASTGRWGSALYFLSAGFITAGVLLIPKFG